ncbi:MAG TPA: helix-turn-helix domain-containing protein [Ktedonobacteraceae bacterium]|nr:helix-turn-helix domain-containing protein [Ktedonobacteraceae bacterium]
MLVKRGYRAELDLNTAQITLARKHVGASRWAYNYGLRRKQEAYKAGQPTPSATDLHREINALKPTEIP